MKGVSYFSRGDLSGRQSWIAQVCAGVLLSTYLAACGGGGGGSSDSGGGGGSATGVRVLHAVIDGAPVDVTSSAGSGALASKVFFADSNGYSSLPSGTQTIRLTRALDQGIEVASVNVTSSGDDSFSILYFGSFSDFGVRAKVLEDVAPTDISGAAVRFVNGVTGASTLLVNASGSTGAQQVPLGDASDYMMVAAGDVRLTANAAVGGGAVLSINESLEQGAAYTVLVAGEAGYYTKGVVFRDR